MRVWLTSVPVAWPRAGGVALVALCAAGGAWSQGGLIYSCIDATGKKITRDRVIAECNSREQRVLNADGSLRQILAPPMTADERTDSEARAREAEGDRVQRRDAVKRDRNLLTRFPNEAAHRKSREQALDDVRKALAQSQARLAALATERKPLGDEAEFYVGKQLPLKLKLALDANDASVDAQKTLVQNQQLEIVRIDKLYDEEREHLKKLWGGAQLGSVGMVAGTAAAAASAPRKK